MIGEKNLNLKAGEIITLNKGIVGQRIGKTMLF